MERKTIKEYVPDEIEKKKKKKKKKKRACWEKAKEAKWVCDGKA